jgi:low affinity Fe/Cu permease
MSMQTTFGRFAAAIARYSGKPAAFVIAALMIVVWAATGPLFRFGDTWQLVINTGTTIITFLMVFLIQNTQNRDTSALQIKLDELIRCSRAHNALLNLEELDDKTLERIRRHYCHLAELARDDLEHFEDNAQPGEKH